jgi:hypothetical protein
MKKLILLIALGMALTSGNSFAYDREYNDNQQSDRERESYGHSDRDNDGRDSSHGGRLESQVDHLNRMLGHVRWELTRYRGDWRLRHEVERLSGDVSRVNWRFRHGYDHWKLRGEVESLHGELHRIEQQLHVRRGDWYRW